MSPSGPADATLSLRESSQGYRIKRLIVSSPDATGGASERTIVLSQPHVRIGTSPANDLVLGDPHASRFHCELRLTDDGYLLRDLGSTNGTRVGAVEVKEALLHPGATVEVGETKIRFLADEGRPDEIAASKSERFGDVLGHSVRMREVFGVLEKIAPTELTVLLAGETGTGKDVTARALHARSTRARGPFVVFDCAAVAPTLIESELFGHVKGAFTGATSDTQGAFERAHGGTLLLDEIGELALELQPKLLRALEQRTVRPVGGAREIPVDVRIIAATHRNLDRAVKQGTWRQDLFFRLSVVTIELPPLRQRIEDLALLVDGILAPRSMHAAPETLRIFERYDWPGNVRELRNVVDSAAALAGSPVLEPRHLVFFTPRRSDESLSDLDLAGKSLQTIERAAIVQTLERCKGNKTRAAKTLGISTSTLYEKVKKYDI
ncbi:MAG: sigma 54-interacting transcriptional regulator [Polyangia bacterium]